MKIIINKRMKKRDGYSYINHPLENYPDGIGLGQTLRLPRHSYSTYNNNKIITTDIRKAKKIDQIIKKLRW